MTYKRQRFPYIDVCKGLLILMVVAHHITNMGAMTEKIHEDNNLPF